MSNEKAPNEKEKSDTWTTDMLAKLAAELARGRFFVAAPDDGYALVYYAQRKHLGDEPVRMGPCPGNCLLKPGDGHHVTVTAARLCEPWGVDMQHAYSERQVWKDDAGWTIVPHTRVEGHARDLTVETCQDGQS